MPTLFDRLEGRNERIDFDCVATRYPWLYQADQDCIISPDSDGLLCGLFMSHYLGWRVRGFYDTKVLVYDSRVTPETCVFLDAEVCRSGVRSVGQHMLLYNRNQIPPNWGEFDDCFAVNNFRDHDGRHDFQLKYPFGTIHLLVAALGATRAIALTESAIAPLLFTDGTYHNLFRYTENSLNWLQYLRADEQASPLHILFCQTTYTIRSLMSRMNEFWRARDQISNVPGERGDRVAISPRGGASDPENLELLDDSYRFNADARGRAELFIHLLQECTGWQYTPEHWCWSGWTVRRFTKEDFASSRRRLNGQTFAALMAVRPLSFAMTSGQNYEYTLETPDRL